MRRIGFIIMLVVLAACATSPAPAPPQSAAPTLAVSPAPAASGDVAQTLTAQLKGDEVLVQQITLSPNPPATLTVEYQLNEKKMPIQTPQAIEVLLALEGERSVQAIARRVVQQVAAGATIERVILREHITTEPAQSRLVSVADMQAWVNGTLNDDQFRERWCCQIQ